MGWQPTQEELDDLLAASEATYSRTVPLGFVPFVVSNGDEIDADGYYGAAYTNGSEVIIAFEGTVADPTDAYGGGSLYADLLLAAGLTPQGVDDAETFAAIVLAVAAKQGISKSDIFVVGHSLGGVEAEAVAAADDLAGATFGAPGLPDYTNMNGDPNLIDYVDYGDPVGNYSSDSQAVTSGAIVGPPPPADHVGTLQYVGSPTDTVSIQISSLALQSLQNGNLPAALGLAAAAFDPDQQYHSLDNYRSLLSGLPPSPVQVDVTGSISTNLSENTQNNTTTYSYVSVSANLTLNEGAPLTLSVTAVPLVGTEYWNSFGTWDSGGVLKLQYANNAGIAVTNLISGVLDLDPLVFWQFAPTVNTLENIGPTNGSLTIPGIGSANVFGVPISVGASIQLAYDVTIGDGANVLMDQANVNVSNLIIDPEGTLFAGSGGFTVDNDLTNEGSLAIVVGQGGTIGQDLINSGNLLINGPFQVAGMIYNDGNLEVDASAFDIANSVENLDGTIEADLGATARIGSLVLGGTIEALSGGTVQIGNENYVGTGTVVGGTILASTGGTVVLGAGYASSFLENVTLGGDGSGAFQGAVSGSTYEGGTGYGPTNVDELQNVSIGPGVTYYSSNADNLTAFAGTIDNRGVLAQSAGNINGQYFAADGPVTLTGGGQLMLAGQLVPGTNSNLYAPLLHPSSAVAELVNQDNTISGYGAIYVPVTNQAGGVIDGDAAGEALVFNEDVLNQGLVEASGGVFLGVSGTTSTNGNIFEALASSTLAVGGPLDNSGGTIEALSGGTVQIGNENYVGTGTVVGGTILASTGGTVVLGAGYASSFLENVTLGGDGSGAFQGAVSGSTYEGGTGYGPTNVDELQNVSIGPGVTYYSSNADNLTAFAGTIDNRGVLAQSAGNINGQYFAADGPVTLTGGGQLMLAGQLVPGTNSNLYAPLLHPSSAVAELVNQDNTISGYGAIYVPVTNQAGGVIDGDAAGEALVFNEDVLNQGLVEAVSGELDLSSNVNNADGTIGAYGGSVKLSGITVSGGTFNGSSTGMFEVMSSATLNGTSTAITVAPDARLAVSAGSTLTLLGTITNEGTLTNDGTVTNGGTLTDPGIVINENILLGSEVMLTDSGTLSNLAGATVSSSVTATAAVETVSNLGTVSGAVSLAGGDRLITGAGAVFSGGINGGVGGNTLEIATGPYVLTNFDVPGTPQYTTLQIDNGVSVTTDTSDMLIGVTLVNQGMLNLDASEITTLVQNAGEITGDVTLSGGGSLINMALGTIFGTGLAAVEGVNGPVSVMNSGVIGSATYGVYLTAGGSVTNAAGATIDGTVAGVLIAGGPGSVSNTGTVGDGEADTVASSSSETTPQILTLNAVSLETLVGPVQCFAAGTRIETADGRVAVEALRVGDRVILAKEGEAPVVWVGSRAVDCARHPRPETVWPVRVKREAFGPGVPGRTLYLSPDHAVYVDGVLVPVKLLVNGASIAQVKRQGVVYYHVELMDHEVILAEGLPVESYLDTGDRVNFHQNGDTIRLFPDFTARLAPETAMVWETRGAAPLVMTGPELIAARQQVSALAKKTAGVRTVA